MERYRQPAAAQGLTPEGFESRAPISPRGRPFWRSSSALDAKVLADLAMKLYLSAARCSSRAMPRGINAQVKPTEAEIEAYYKEHPREFSRLNWLTGNTLCWMSMRCAKA